MAITSKPMSTSPANTRNSNSASKGQGKKLYTEHIMLIVLGALVPGIGAMAAVWGWGILWNIAILSAACGTMEIISLMFKGQRHGSLLSQPGNARRSSTTVADSVTDNSGHNLSYWADILHQCRDFSWLVTAWLIALCLPPFTHWWVLCIAALGAIGLAKHAYGGLGHNIFNPAMVGYAIILVSFPTALTSWPTIVEVTSIATPDVVDGFSGATLLTEYRYRAGLTNVEFAGQYAEVISNTELISYAFLLGGGVLIYLRLVAWRVPMGMLLGVAFAALVGYDQGSSESVGGLWFHITSGGFVVAALFVATDPVTHPMSQKHQYLFGALIGVLIYAIRGFGVYPDGIAFAILLGNCVTPLFNRLHNHKPPDRLVAQVNMQADPGDTTLESQAEDEQKAGDSRK